MVDSALVDKIKHFVLAARSRGIHTKHAILFGSFARGTQDEWSDIDLLVVAPEFDGVDLHDPLSALWTARVDSDLRIEPIHCGELEWGKPSVRPIVEIARREGIEVPL